MGGGESRRVRLRPAAVVVWIALAACCVWAFGASLEALVNAVGCAVIVAVTVTDLERRIVPNRIVVPALAVALVVQTVRDPSVEWILSALGAGGFFLLLALVNPAGLGMGDVKLAAFLGAWLGYAVAVALFVGALLGAVPALVLLARRRSEGPHDHAPVRSGARRGRGRRPVLRRRAARRLARLSAGPRGPQRARGARTAGRRREAARR